MSLRKAFMMFWLGGLVVFILAIGLGLAIVADGGPGILDHQSAGTAKAVNAIHAAWETVGQTSLAKAAMMADLVFIGLFGLGSVLGGWYYWRTGSGAVAVFGMLALCAALLFIATDYAETGAQFIQLMRDRGGDRLAGLAATMQPIKQAAFVFMFAGIIAAFALRRVLDGPALD